MKIVVLSSHTPSLFWFRMDMMKEFQSRGAEVIAIANEDETLWKDKFAELGIRYIQANISRNGTNPIKDLATLKDLNQILKSERPDKIFAFQAKTVIYGALAAHNLGIIEYYPLIAGLGSVFLKDGLKAKLVKTVLETEYRMALRRSKKVFFQNQDDVDLFVKERMTKKDQVVMLPGSGVNLEKFTPQPQPQKTAFLMISRLIRDKGVYEYLEAAKQAKQKLPEARFMLVGPYDSNPSALKPEELQKFIDDGTIEYFGERSDVRPYLSDCSVYVLPSYREGTPKTNLEAMATGRAIITTDAPGCKETVCDGYNGYLVPVKDVQALAGRMVELGQNPAMCETMGRNGLETVKKFDVKNVDRIICETMGI